MARRTPNELEESRRHAAKLMKRIMAQLRASMDERLRPYGVTTAQIRLLFAIHTAPGSSGAQLSRQCEVTPQSAQVLIQRAEEAGWIVRGKDSINDRIVTASLTPAGEELLKIADGLMRSIEAKLWQKIPPSEINCVIEVLEKCLLNVSHE
ncbi:MarR family winged helix-turn-helix transcriptional regulator [Acidicapsa ligni]|uniref:MarR family winged helix-turn-helix transcriptional regulator n=1 Tax=Acidicapsa ligni TaxID=542300 RepID=UPI0021E09CF3|nr:MarR family winged helix-turn-helix transcriptional regulator [Acidicapsa ligni]